MRHWTLEERQKQAQLIHNWKPWDKSTGAKTPEGADVSKMNAMKHGLRSAEILMLKRELARNRQEMEQINNMVWPIDEEQINEKLTQIN